MTDDDDDPNATKAALATLGAGAAAHELYIDAFKPAAQELGKNFTAVAKAITLALSPIHGLVWGAEKIRGWLSPELEKRLADVSPDDIQEPPKIVAGQIMMQLMFCAEEQELRELYANLLAAAMTKGTAAAAHPAFVQVIQQLAPHEAVLLRQIIRDATPDVFEVHRNQILNFMVGHDVSYVDFSNICERCGLQDKRSRMEGIDNLVRLKILSEGRDPLTGHSVSLSSFGRRFLQICVREPGHPYPMDPPENPIKAYSADDDPTE